MQYVTWLYFNGGTQIVAYGTEDDYHDDRDACEGVGMSNAYRADGPGGGYAVLGNVWGGLDRPDGSCSGDPG